MVFLAERGFAYGVNVAIVGVTSYIVLFLTLPIVTPVIEALGKDITALVWMTAQEKSPPRRRTLFPFPEDLFQGREANGDAKDDIEANSSNRSSALNRDSIFAGKNGEKGEVYEDSPPMSEAGWMNEKGKGADRS
jgi:hypothetical protein